ncbi:hypothetical protein SADUNF_Sadunf01G0092200 [Salix dunnii]|uniref:Uncharacterized protein n=1 Tax=Salix dunnii TaxID=1413687 RepID=A0A835NAR3_9ROSI|nr:hypothetical protein SADUNF_Sadunf01G0092200 [Salix dunnii]
MDVLSKDAKGRYLEKIDALVLNFSSTVFLYVMFSFLILVMIFWSYKPSKDELDEPGHLYCFHVKMHMLRERVRKRTIRMLNRHVRRQQQCECCWDFGWQNVYVEIDENLEKRIEDLHC